MSGGPQGDSNKAKFSSRNPHFFKIILEDTLKENRLRVPKTFVKKCGETFSDSVYVKLPCGSKWRMKLTEYDGKLWLDNGWPEFVEHYSIERGNLLTFRYEGNSELYVVLFDTTTLEIDYPSGPVHFDGSNIDGKLRAPKRELNNDDFVEMLDDCYPCHKTGVRSSLPCSPPLKKMKTSPKNLSNPEAEGSHRNKTVIKNRMRRGNTKGKHDFLGKSNGDKSRQKTCKILGGMKTLRGHEKYAALRKASGFKSKRPFFKILMQTSYVHGTILTLSSAFATRYIEKQSCNVNLKVLDGRTWSVKYTFGFYNRLRTARFENGWKKFARDNNLKIGDVCVFVLLKDIEISFEVIIFRVNGNSKTPMSPAPDGGATQVKTEQSLENETESGGAVNDEISGCISHKSLRAKQGNGCISTPWKTRKHRCLNFIEKARILKRAPFESEKPFFKFVIQSSYTYTGTLCHLPVPLEFAERYIKNEGHALLSVPNGRSWSAQFKVGTLRTGKHAAAIYGCWKDFARDNNLEVGDVCIFELLDGTEISFQVSIIRVADNAYSQRSKTAESAH